jgi:hypothetical protein
LAGETDNAPAPGERVAVVGCGTSWFMATPTLAVTAYPESPVVAAADAARRHDPDPPRHLTRCVVLR